jgi:hypothetical protein
VAPLLCVVFVQALRARLLSVRAPGRTWPDMMQAVDLTWPRRVSSLSIWPRSWVVPPWGRGAGRRGRRGRRHRAHKAKVVEGRRSRKVVEGRW